MVGLTLEVAVPGADDARVGYRVVGHGRLFVVEVPILPEHLSEVAAFVWVDLEVADFDTVNHEWWILLRIGGYRSSRMESSIWSKKVRMPSGVN